MDMELDHAIGSSTSPTVPLPSIPSVALPPPVHPMRLRASVTRTEPTMREEAKKTKSNRKTLRHRDKVQKRESLQQWVENRVVEKKLDSLSASIEGMGLDREDEPSADTPGEHLVTKAKKEPASVDPDFALRAEALQEYRAQHQPSTRSARQRLASKGVDAIQKVSGQPPGLSLRKALAQEWGKKYSRKGGESWIDPSPAAAAQRRGMTLDAYLEKKAHEREMRMQRKEQKKNAKVVVKEYADDMDEEVKALADEAQEISMTQSVKETQERSNAGNEFGVQSEMMEML